MVRMDCNVTVPFLFFVQKVVLPILLATAVRRSSALQDDGRQNPMIESAAKVGAKTCIGLPAMVTLGSIESERSFCSNIGWILRKTEQYCPLILPDGELEAIH